MDAKAIISKFEKAVVRLSERGPVELIAQGHVATKRLINNFEEKINASDLNRIRGMIMTLDYGLEVDTGLSALQVRQKGNKHLLEILDWIFIIAPNMPAPEKRRFAQNTTRKHRRVGVPTEASKRFSKTGKRTGWIRSAFESEQAKAELEKDLDFLQEITAILDETVQNLSNGS